MKTGLLAFLALCSAAMAADLSRLSADRAAIERVYYNHRLGEKLPFEQTMPPALIERLVKEEQRKEAALKKVYGVEVTPAMLDAELQRISNTTSAPEMPAEIKAALGNDTNRFARAVARPIVVERLLRERFDNDDALHAPQRREMEEVREQLLAAKARGDSITNLIVLLRHDRTDEVSETTWQLGARPVETNAPDADEIEIKKRFGPNAQILSSPHAGRKDETFYFEDLPGELQNVLRLRLRQPGDVSSVIETPGGFLLYLAEVMTVRFELV